VHGVVWEWVLDLGSMMVSADNREAGRPGPETILRHRGSQPGAEGELRHAHAHRDPVQHAG
jgi:hypothetical protein